VISAVPISLSAASAKGVLASIEVAVDHHAAMTARRQVCAVLQTASTRDEVRVDVELLVTELVSNLIRHEQSPTMSIDVAVDVAGSVTVSVTGGLNDPVAALVHAREMPEPSAENGRGLVILDSLASSWGTRRKNGRTTVWFTVNDATIIAGADEATSVPAVAGDLAPTAGAAAVMVEAAAVVAAAAAELTAAPDVVAIRAAATAEQAALDAAAKTAFAARRARDARAVAATAAAACVAEAAARTVLAVRAHADVLACAAAAAAAQAATAASDSIAAGGEAEAARAALDVAAVVISRADVAAEEAAHAAMLVAREVATTAAAVASTTAKAAAAIEHEVLDAAADLRAVTTTTARALAADTVERNAAAALATREAVAASDASAQRLHQANRRLQRAGRHDRIIALALQEAMLTRLPQPDNLLLAARYITAAKEDQIGGDWYDALVLPTGITSLVIGDVIGHDIEAAATMGQLRNILRALVWDRNEAPAAVISRLDRAIDELHIDTTATLILANVEPPSADHPNSVATLRWSNAGHPAPVLIHADGTAKVLDASTDVLLGAQPDTMRRNHLHPVPPGATLLLYTDGLVETRTHDIDVDQPRLLDAARAHHRLQPGDLLDAIVTDMVGDRPADDVAVLAARFADH
jgi:serine phosphatase RsbU (regulator of sigma subunit)/anti-sigma regulatory factor (Ser/Thr protein kinase)